MIRFFDIVFCSLAILFISPLLIFIIVILKFSGEGEIFYLQKRVGYQNNNFNLIKFVTMKKDSEITGTGTITIKNDPRVLPFGKLLRKSKINELPQLIKKSALIISNDSAPLHIASSLQVPSISLFGPTDSRNYGPYPPGTNQSVVFNGKNKNKQCLFTGLFRRRTGCSFEIK